MMNPVFADTFYFLALLNKRDEQRERVLSMTRKLQGELVTSEWVFMELADALADTLGRPLVRPFIERFRSDARSTVIPASQSIFERGLELYSDRKDMDWSLTDCTSFVIMTDRHLREALTGDHHFEQAGYVALLK